MHFVGISAEPVVCRTFHNRFTYGKEARLCTNWMTTASGTICLRRDDSLAPWKK